MENEPLSDSFNGTVRPHFRVITREGVSSLHAQSVGRRASHHTTLRWNPAERQWVALMNPLTGEASAEVSVLDGQDQVWAKRQQVASLGACLVELPPANGTLSPQFIRVRADVPLRYHIVVASENNGRISVDHILTANSVARYRYLIPSISVAPPPGYRFVQVLPMDPLRDLIATRGRMVLSIRREVVRSGEVLAEDERTVTLDGGRWDDPSVGEYSFDSVDDGGWQAQGDLAYVETSITAVGDGWFHSHFQPSHYSIYAGPDRKTFFSDNNWKFGNPNTIKQIATFGKWVEGYPVAHVDAALDAGESLVVINPFEAETSVKIHLQGHDDLSVRRSIAPLGGTRIDLGALWGPIGFPGRVRFWSRARPAWWCISPSMGSPTPPR